MFTWIKEFFGIGLTKVEEEIKHVEVKVQEVAASTIQTATTGLEKVETEIKAAISTAVASEEKAVKAVKAGAKKAKDGVEKVVKTKSSKKNKQ